jgi:outer membrane protein assembly factor BamD (BamD/ComL family)
VVEEPAEQSGNPKPGAKTRAKRTSAEAPVDPAASIREQTAMIDAARRKLRAGNPGGAVAELDRYHRKYKQGMFGQEAIMLRIEALSRSGNQSAARSLAKRFLANKPSSQYAKRIESLVGPVD